MTKNQCIPIYKRQFPKFVVVYKVLYRHRWELQYACRRFPKFVVVMFLNPTYLLVCLHTKFPKFVVTNTRCRVLRNSLPLGSVKQDSAGDR